MKITISSGPISVSFLICTSGKDSHNQANFVLTYQLFGTSQEKRMIIFCKSQLDLLCRERLRLQLELLRLPLVMIVQHRHPHPRDQWPENSRSLSIDESHARWGLMSITTAGNGENIPQTGAGKVSPSSSSSSSSLGQSHPTAGKAKRAAHFAPPALSSEVGSDHFSLQTDTSS